MSSLGVSAQRGVSAWGEVNVGGCLLGECLPDTPYVNRITDRCKNINYLADGKKAHPLFDKNTYK